MHCRTAVVTIVAKNYLAQARVLMDSARRWNPDFIRLVILVDLVDGYFDPDKEDFTIISSEELGIPDSRWFHFKYTILELSTAVKPYALEFLLHRFDLRNIIYLDPDIRIYASLDPLVRHLKSANILLTPHLTGQLDDDRHPGELEILRSGSYNLGFIAITHREEAIRFLKWWQSRLFDRCVVDVARGLFVDQRWVDLVPGMFDGVRILREPGYNVAYWNLNHREVARMEEGYTVTGHALYFFHFSGFDPDYPEQFSKHQNRFRFSTLGDARYLVSDYRRELLSAGYETCCEWPYAYGSFVNGFCIPDMGRPSHHESPTFKTEIEDPFSEDGFRAFVKLWNQPIVTKNGENAGLTRLAYRIYRSREDVMAEMPDIFGNDYVRFLEWMLSSGRREHSLDVRFLSPVYDALNAAQNHKSPNPSGECQVDEFDADGLPPICRKILKNPRADGIWLKLRPQESQSVPESFNDLVKQGAAGLRLTRLAQYIYETRPDLQRIFPDPCGKDGPKFLIWFLTYGKTTYQLPEPYVIPLRQQWEDVLSHAGSPVQRLKYRLLLTGMSVGIRSRTILSRSRLTAFHRLSTVTSSYTPPPSDHVNPRRIPSISSDRVGNREPGLGCNIIGYLRGEMGVGQSARSAVAAAAAGELGISLRNINVTGPQAERDVDNLSFSDNLPYDVNIFHVNADQTDAAFAVVGNSALVNRYNIGFWAWELEEFPDECARVQQFIL